MTGNIHMYLFTSFANRETTTQQHNLSALNHLLSILDHQAYLVYRQFR